MNRPSPTNRSQLEELDELFYGYPDDLTDLLFAFVQRHPQSFAPTPE